MKLPQHTAEPSPYESILREPLLAIAGCFFNRTPAPNRSDRLPGRISLASDRRGEQSA
jgi:hypothetical protein